MKSSSGNHNRRILQVPVETGSLQASDLSGPDPIFQPTNGSSSQTTSTTNPNHPTSPLDSSMVLTILVLLTALFFMGFFSIYIRRFAEDDSPSAGIRRRRRHPSQPSSALHNQKGCGVDPSTVRALPLVSHRGVAKQRITDCPICLSEFEEREIVKLIPSCRHVFHPECIETWLASHVSCPLCRTTQFLEVGECDDGGAVCLDVQEGEDCNGVGEVGGRSTADDGDTWRDICMTRSCSCTRLGDRLVLQRSMSF